MLEEGAEAVEGAGGELSPGDGVQHGEAAEEGVDIRLLVVAI